MNRSWQWWPVRAYLFLVFYACGSVAVSLFFFLMTRPPPRPTLFPYPPLFRSGRPGAVPDVLRRAVLRGRCRGGERPGYPGAVRGRLPDAADPRRRLVAGGQPPAVVHPHRHARSEEHTSELQSPCNLVCRLLLE